MASFTSRLAGWAAGRLKGEKARKKTMEFVDKTGVGKLLSLAGDAAILGGAGKLAGMGAAKLGFGKGAGAIGGSTGGAPPRLDAAGRVIDSAKEYQQVAPGLPGHLDKMMLKASKDIDSEGVARRITSALGSGSMTPNLPGMEQFGGAVRQSPHPAPPAQRWWSKAESRCQRSSASASCGCREIRFGSMANAAIPLSGTSGRL